MASARLRARLPGSDETLGSHDLFRRHSRCGDVAQLHQSRAIVDERCLTRGDRKPQIGRRVVTGDARAAEIELSEFELRAQVVAVGGMAIPSRGFRRIASDATAFAVEVPNRTLRCGAAMFCGLPIPGQRLALVLRHAKAEIIELPDVKFSVRMTLRRGFAQPVDGLRQIRSAVIEERPERELRDRVSSGGACARSGNSALDGRVDLGACGQDVESGLSRIRDLRHNQRSYREQQTPHRPELYRLRCVALALLLALFQPAAAATVAQAAKAPAVDVVYVPTPQPVVEAMLELARVAREDVVYDLGSGDGRFLITAAKKYGARGVGVELDPALVAKATATAAAEGVSDRVRFVAQNFYDADIREATVVTLYLLQSINERLRPKLVRELKPGTRVVSHVFNMGPEWPPEQTRMVGPSRIFLWTIQ
jgi:SAM-dependent methyltransferase